MLIATLIYIVAVSLGLGLRAVHLPLAPAWKAVVHAVVEIGIVLAVYKLVIVRLGEHPRDDLPAHALFGTSALGCLPAWSSSARSLVLAALVGVYRIMDPATHRDWSWSLSVREFSRLYGGAAIPLDLFRWIEEFGEAGRRRIITSALFGLAHILNPNATWSRLHHCRRGGVLLGGAYMLTRSLWFPRVSTQRGISRRARSSTFLFPDSTNMALSRRALTGPSLRSGGQSAEDPILALLVAAAAGIWMLGSPSNTASLSSPAGRGAQSVRVRLLLRSCFRGARPLLSLPFSPRPLRVPFPVRARCMPRLSSSPRSAQPLRAGSCVPSIRAG